MTSILQKIAQDLLESRDLRVDINSEVDLDKFSSNISLFTYRQEALKNIIAILDLYYSNKIKLKNYYELKGFNENKFTKNKHSSFTLELNSLKDYEKIKNENLFGGDKS